MTRNWRFAPHDESRIRSLAGALNVSPLLAQVLLSRGYETPESARDFLAARLIDLHPPEQLPGIDAATDQVLSALESGRRITIYGDYDVDGTTATSILWHCLRMLNANVDYYIPSRTEEGYGLNQEAIRKLSEEDPDRLLISVDCGIASVDEGRLASELGMDLIVTDHHQMGETLPEAVALVHPRLPGSVYPFGDLCGAGVAFKLAWSICQRRGEDGKATPRMREFLKQAVGLAAIGTVADVVPLLDENRVLVRYGLESLSERPPLGIRTLMKAAEMDTDKPLEAEDVAFTLGPRINAAGRLGQARLAVELLTTDDPERAQQLADYLNQLNKQRQTVERRIFKQAREQVESHPDWLDHPTLVIAHEEWHPGVIGIVANRVAEHFEKPTFLVAIDPATQQGQGSGRSHAGFNLHEALQSCKEYLLKFGGHQAAAGLRIRADGLEGFREALRLHAVEFHKPSSTELELRIDAEIRLADVSHRAVSELNRLGPFGHRNHRPRFAATRVELDGPPRKMGEGERHLSLDLRQHDTRIRAVAFGKGDWADEIAKVNGPLAITFEPNINRWRGRESVQLFLLDWQADES